MVLFVGIVHIFLIVLFYRVETPFLWLNVEFNLVSSQKKRRFKQLMSRLARQIRSASGICLARHPTRLVDGETLEKDKPEMCSPSA